MAWGKVLGGVASPATDAQPVRDRRFSAPEWSENPIFDAIRKSYLQISDQLLGSVEDVEGVDADTQHKLRFAVRSFVDAMSPSNFAVTNPQVLKKTLESRGENLLKGLSNMAGVLERIGPFKWRLVIPWPQSSSKLDVFELTPVANQPK